MNCILYIVDNGDMTVSIMRVMYGGRDIDAQLDKYTKYDEQHKSGSAKKVMAREKIVEEVNKWIKQ